MPATRKVVSRRGSPQLRLRVGFIIIAMVMSVFGVRLVQLQGVDSKALAAKAVANSLVTVVLPAERGDILDRNGQPLAQSVDGLMLVADPSQTSSDAPAIATFLARELDLDYFDTLRRLRKTDSKFQYLARRIPAARATRVLEKADELGFKGLATSRDPVRSYPAHDIGANLVGFLGTPDPHKGVQPLAGFDKLLHYKVPEALRAAIRPGSTPGCRCRKPTAAATSDSPNHPNSMAWPSLVP